MKMLCGKLQVCSEAVSESCCSSTLCSMQPGTVICVWWLMNRDVNQLQWFIQAFSCFSSGPYFYLTDHSTWCHLIGRSLPGGATTELNHLSSVDSLLNYRLMNIWAAWNLILSSFMQIHSSWSRVQISFSCEESFISADLYEAALTHSQ